jgi:ankyrin repeat protein
MPILHRQITVSIAGMTPLMEAIHLGRFEQIAMLIEGGANVNEASRVGLTPLQLAASHGYEHCVRDLLEKGARPDSQNNKVGCSALMFAAAFGELGAVQTLLAGGATVDLKTPDGETALMLAAWGGHQQVVKLLISNGADINARGGPLGGTALHSALWEGHAHVIAELLRTPGIDPLLPDLTGKTPRQIAQDTGRDEIARMLAGAERSLVAETVAPGL